MTTADSHPLTQRDILKFWWPLASTWILMAMEGPLVTAMISRLPNPKHNLAAFGVAFSIALFMEAPVIMLMSASLKLVTDGRSYRKIKRFTQILIVGVTIQFLLALIPQVYRLWSQHLLKLDPDLWKVTYAAVFCLLPWPGAIGYRRFYQGVLIRRNRGRSVAMGTVVRISTIIGVCWMGLSGWIQAEGAVLGVLALSAGVTVEALLAGLLARGAVVELKPLKLPESELLTRKKIWDFYYPLVLTALMSLCIQPLVTLSLGRAPFPLESLAVVPVVNAIIFFFRAVPISYQEVVISLMGQKGEGWYPLQRFARTLAVVLMIALGLIVFTPFASLILQYFYELPRDLQKFALPPLQIMILMPVLSVILAWERSYLIHQQQTKLLTVASVLEVTAIGLVLWIGTTGGWTPGINVAALALIMGRIAATVYLRPYVRKPLT